MTHCCHFMDDKIKLENQFNVLKGDLSFSRHSNAGKRRKLNLSVGMEFSHSLMPQGG